MAIDIMANIFLNFRNKDFGLANYSHECKKLETSLSNEVLLKNEVSITCLMNQLTDQIFKVKLMSGS